MKVIEFNYNIILIFIVVDKHCFDYLSIIGRGGFGKVWKVNYKKENTLYAMKEMSKAKIIDKRSEKGIKGERDLLSKLHHPFIVNMHYSFQDKDKLYLVMDLLTGGDLRYHICKRHKFTESQSRFFIACLLLALEYCHSNHIIHRDIKPENLVLDSKGYLHLTDFGIAKTQQPNNYRETSGTPGYMSPEVMCAQNHTIVVDYFAIGVMGYEFMKGVRPYYGKSRKEIKDKIIAKQAMIKLDDLDKNWSVDSADCINKLLQRKPAHRLGLHGAREVKEHTWFKDFPWKDLYNFRLEAPFIPPNADNFDHKYCNEVENQGLKTRERFEEIKLKDNYKTIFKDYLYFNRYDLSSHDNKSIYINIHESMYKDRGDNNEQRINNINENYMSLRFMHYRNSSINKMNKNLNKSKSDKNFMNFNANHIRSYSVANLNSLGPNQAFWEASIYAKFRKNLKKSKKIILDKQKMTVNPSNAKTNYNSLLINTVNDNLTSNNFDIQNSKSTEPILKNAFETSIKARKTPI